MKGNNTLPVYRWATGRHQQYKNSDCCTELIYAVFITPATIECMQVFKWSIRYFCPVLTEFGISRNIFVNAPQYQISRHFVQLETRWYKRNVGQTDTMHLIGTFGDYVNTPKKMAHLPPIYKFYFIFKPTSITPASLRFQTIIYRRSSKFATTARWIILEPWCQYETIKQIYIIVAG